MDVEKCVMFKHKLLHFAVFLKALRSVEEKIQVIRVIFPFFWY